MAGPDDLEINDPRFPGQGRLDAFRPDQPGGRQNAVQQDAGPDHVHTALRKLQEGGRVGHMPQRSGKRTLPVKRKDLLEPFELQPGVAEVRATIAWEPKISPTLGTTPAPTAEELRRVREELDPDGVYTK